MVKFRRRSSLENESGIAAIDRPTPSSRAYIGQKIRVAARVLLGTSTSRVRSAGHQVGTGASAKLGSGSRECEALRYVLL
jgi:hypothetical protein